MEIQQVVQIAVVDDDSRVRESIGSLLETVGYRFVVFDSAEGLLRSPTLTEYHCVITDIRMPGMDGIELVRRLKARRANLPVIGITAHNDDVAERHAMDEGVICFLHKPFGAAELLNCIRLALVQRTSSDGA